ncbi:MAG: hypothetical protein ACI4V3_06800 [Faecousia sp.]
MKKRTHFFLSLLLICISAGLLGLLLSNMRHNAKSVADILAREDLNIDVGIFAKQDIPEKLLPELIDPSGERENLIYSFDSSEQYCINRFLTYFSEQSFGSYDSDDSAALVDFAYRYVLLHRVDYEALSEDDMLDTVNRGLVADNLSYMLASNTVDSVTERFFGTTLQHTEEAYSFLRTGIEAGNRISVAKAMYANEDGSYTVAFDIYESNAQPTSCPFRQDELSTAQPREDWYDNRLFSSYAESAYPNQHWEYIGTTSGVSAPDPDAYLAYDIYRVDSFGASLLFVTPYGGIAPAPVVYAYDAANHTMTLVFSNGSFLDRTYFTLSDLDARVHPDLTYISSGTAVVRWHGEASNAVYQLIAYEAGDGGTHQAVRFESDEQYRLNLFLSNFSEQYYGHYDADDKDALIRFAYVYLKINDFDALEPTEDNRMLLPTAAVDRVLNRFFGSTIEHTESAYYFPMADGEAYARFSVATAMSANSDGTYRVAFDIYELSPTDIRYDSVPSQYYALTASDAREHTGISLCGSGTAVIRDYTIGNYATYQVISYQSDEY